jgi:hypothetical protein
MEASIARENSWNSASAQKYYTKQENCVSRKKIMQYVVGAATGVFEVNGKEGYSNALSCVGRKKGTGPFLCSHLPRPKG